MKTQIAPILTRVSIILIVISIITSCNSDDSVIDKLTANQQLWEASNVKNYTISERYSCFCGGVLNWKTFVENGEKVDITFEDPEFGEPEDFETVFQRARTIDDVFDFLANLYTQDVASIVVEYDETYGFPKVINVDYIANAIDDEIIYLYTDFEITN